MKLKETVSLILVISPSDGISPDLLSTGFILQDTSILPKLNTIYASLLASCGVCSYGLSQKLMNEDEQNSNQSEKYQTLTKEYLSLARDLYSHQTTLSDEHQEKYQMVLEFMNSIGLDTKEKSHGKKKKLMRRKKKDSE